MIPSKPKRTGLPGTPALKWTVGIVALVLGAILIYRDQVPSPPLDTSIHEEMGRVLAREVLKIVGPGSKLVVVTRNVMGDDLPAGRVQWKALVGELEAAQKKVAVTNLVKVDPLRIPSVLPGDYFEILRKLGPEDVVISFMGPPLLTDGQRKQLESRFPKMVAVCTGALGRQMKMSELLKNKQVTVGIVDRPGGSKSLVSGDALKWDDLYQVVTVADAATLAGNP